jgi:hypothetical protein
MTYLSRSALSLACAGMLAFSALLGSSSIAQANEQSSDTEENLVAVADEGLLQDLEVASLASVAPGDGEVTVSGLDGNALALVPDDGRFGVLASTIENSASEQQARFEMSLPVGATAVLNESEDVISYFSRIPLPRSLQPRDELGEHCVRHGVVAPKCFLPRGLDEQMQPLKGIKREGVRTRD